jgi:NAD-specific glutamate dehydrogenase
VDSNSRVYVHMLAYACARVKVSNTDTKPHTCEEAAVHLVQTEFRSSGVLEHHNHHTFGVVFKGGQHLHFTQSTALLSHILLEVLEEVRISLCRSGIDRITTHTCEMQRERGISETLATIEQERERLKTQALEKRTKRTREATHERMQ